MNPLRLAVGLTNRVYVGRLTKDGKCFKEGKQDVTNDFYKAVVDRFSQDDEVHTITCSDGRTWVIRLTPSQTHAVQPKFDNVYCSNCGRDFGPGDHGFSHCENHKGLVGKS